jgi:hypothetical protein
MTKASVPLGVRIRSGGTVREPERGLRTCGSVRTLFVHGTQAAIQGVSPLRRDPIRR